MFWLKGKITIDDISRVAFVAVWLVVQRMSGCSRVQSSPLKICFSTISQSARKGDSLTIDRVTTTPAAMNPVIEALMENVRRTFTKNGAPSYNSTNSTILFAFINFLTHNPGQMLPNLFQNPGLKILSWIFVWYSLRSIPRGKGLEETFLGIYRVRHSVFLHTYPFF